MRGLGRRTVLALVVCLGLLVGGALPAAATNYWYSPMNYYGPTLGITYFNEGVLYDPSGQPGSEIYIGRHGGGNIPAGYSRGQGSLYRNGTLCASAAMVTKSTAVTGWYGGSVTARCGSGTYTARGSTGAYNGTGASDPYDYYYTSTSPGIGW